MTELATYQPNSALSTAPAPAFVPDYQSRAVQRLSDWVASADAAYNVAARLVESSFVPQQFRGKPIEATAAILAGSEVGLSPMAALRSFDIIQGQAAPRAITLRAIVQSFGHEIVLEESTSTRCIMRGKRRGSAEWQRVSWTIDRAKDLGLTGKDQWKKQPTAMLTARATSELCRLVAADAILGIGYTTEELNDGATGEPAEVVEAPAEEAPAQPATRRMSRPRAAAPEPVEETPVEDTPADDEPLSATRAQLTKIHAQFGDLPITDRAERLAKVAGIIERDIETSNDLTRAEASKVIERLDYELGVVTA